MCLCAPQIDTQSSESRQPSWWEPLSRSQTASVCAVALLGGMACGEKPRGQERTLSLRGLGSCANVTMWYRRFCLPIYKMESY